MADEYYNYEEDTEEEIGYKPADLFNPEGDLTYEELLAKEPGTLVSQDLALARMMVDDKNRPYDITQYGLNKPGYGLSGRYSRTPTGRTPYQGRGQFVENIPETIGMTPQGPTELREDDAGADYYTMNQFSQDFDWDSPYGGYGSQEAYDFMQGDYLSGLGTYGKLQGINLGTGIASALGAGASPGMIVNALPGYFGSILANPMTMLIGAGYTANEAFDLAARGSEMSKLETALNEYGVNINSPEAQSAIAELGRSRQSMTGLNRMWGGIKSALGLGSSLSNQDAIAMAASKGAFGTWGPAMDEPAVQEAMAQAAEKEKSARREKALSEYALAKEDVSSTRAGLAGMVAQPGGTFSQALDWGYGFGTEQPTISEWSQAKEDAAELGLSGVTDTTSTEIDVTSLGLGYLGDLTNDELVEIAVALGGVGGAGDSDGGAMGGVEGDRSADLGSGMGAGMLE